MCIRDRPYDDYDDRNKQLVNKLQTCGANLSSYCSYGVWCRLYDPCLLYTSESTETVEDTEKVDERTETVADTEVIDTEEDIPEEAAPEEEQIPDQEYTWRDTTAERNLYYDDWSKENMGRIYLGETLEELFQMYEDPTLEMAGWEDFFEGTCFAGATLEDLKWLQESGYTMDQLIQIASDNNRSSVWQMLSGIALMAAYKDKTVRCV